jgi:catechol 2,3-dioxygenase-like lactoylglutathione lyase family enzyme
MPLKKMEHVGVVVEDLPAATAFFEALGFELEGETSVAGDHVDRINNLSGVHAEMSFLRTPDGSGTLEVIRYHEPPLAPGAADPAAPANALGIRHLTFLVDDVRATVAELEGHGGELVGEIVNYEDIYLLCYLRGPAGIIVELAEKLSAA